MNTKLSIIIATHNRGPVLAECLTRTLACTAALPKNAVEVLVVDNASTDDTPDLLAKNFPTVTLLRAATNAGPVNKNLAIARSTGEFLLLLDDDAYPHPGTLPQLLRHFAADPSLAAAVCDVTLPDGSKEASAYPDVFIGAGTALRRSALDTIHALPHPLPQHFFMQAEEYDLSFRLISAGFTVKRFPDLPVTHLKTPNARIAARTTCLDVRNNLFLLARYLPDPLCHHLAADWLDRYFRIALRRDKTAAAGAGGGGQSHKKAFLRGAAEGLAHWSHQRDHHRHLLSPQALERLFKFNVIKHRLALAAKTYNARRLLLADYGKSLFPFFTAARDLALPVLAVADDHLANPENPADNYRGIPLLTWKALHDSPLLPKADLIVVANLNPVQAPRRVAALRRTLPQPVVDLFDPATARTTCPVPHEALA
jgi:glycosyltransferase involved in cell wall biosynthesis